MKQDVIITGANGQLGQELRACYKENALLNFIFFDSATLDITNAEAVKQIGEKYPGAWCINTAAYTQVDLAETDPEPAFVTNAYALEHIGKAFDHVIHISTDYVYHNKQAGPLDEDSPTQPKGMYAQSKRQGEKKLIEFCPLSIIIRTSWLYSSFGNNFVKTMLRIGPKNESINVVVDQLGAPTYARNLAEAIIAMLSKIKLDEIESPWGIYNYSDAGETTWANFARYIFDYAKISCQVLDILSHQFGSPAPRPNNSVLDCTHITSTFNLTQHPWEKSVETCLDILLADL